MKLLFGGLIAILLLGLYVYSVIEAILVATSVYPKGAFTTGFANTLTTVGGLVSALVIAELAITKPGEAPVTRALDSNGEPASPQRRLTVTLVTVGYVLIWIVAGLASYVVGNLWYPTALEALTNHGQAWLGLAVAAGYAYFGLTPK